MNRTAALCLLSLSAMVAAGCGDDDEAEKETLTLQTVGTPGIYVEDQPPKGSTPGDQRTFNLNLVGEDGKPAGTLDGSTTITAVTGRGDDRRDSRIGTIQFTLGDGNTLVANGVYSARPDEFLPAAGVTRPIVGGTGKYKGASGEVTQTPEGKQIKNVLEIETED